MSHNEPKISLFCKKLKTSLFVKNNNKTKSKKKKKAFFLYQNGH